MLLTVLEFTTTPISLLLIGGLAAAGVLLWNWRLTLVSLFIVQVGLAANAIVLQGLPTHWALVESAVMGLACLILALSANHAMGMPSQYQAGTWMLRLMTMALVVVAWQVTDIRFQLPEIEFNVSQLYVWLGVCALVSMSMSNNPFFIGAALLLWLIPVQAATSAILAIPSLSVLLGILELLVALACSYLILVEREPERDSEGILTDITFPAYLASPNDEPVRRTVPMPHRQIPARTRSVENHDTETSSPMKPDRRSGARQKSSIPMDTPAHNQPLRRNRP